MRVWLHSWFQSKRGQPRLILPLRAPILHRMLPKDVFEAFLLRPSHYPEPLSKEIANTCNWKTTNSSWSKQLLNPLSSPFHLYGGNFLSPQLTAIALINPWNFYRSLQISLNFSVNIIDPPRGGIMCKNIKQPDVYTKFSSITLPKPYMKFMTFTMISIHLEFHSSIVTNMIPFICFVKW